MDQKLVRPDPYPHWLTVRTGEGELHKIKDRRKPDSPLRLRQSEANSAERREARLHEPLMVEVPIPRQKNTPGLDSCLGDDRIRRVDWHQVDNPRHVVTPICKDMPHAHWDVVIREEGEGLVSRH